MSMCMLLAEAALGVLSSSAHLFPHSDLHSRMAVVSIFSLGASVIQSEAREPPQRARFQRNPPNKARSAKALPRATLRLLGNSQSNSHDLRAISRSDSWTWSCGSHIKERHFSPNSELLFKV